MSMIWRDTQFSTHTTAEEKAALLAGPDTLPDNTHADHRMRRWPAQVDAARRTAAGVTVESLPTLGALQDLQGAPTTRRHPRSLSEAFPRDYADPIEAYTRPGQWFGRVALAALCLGGVVLISWLISKAV